TEFTTSSSGTGGMTTSSSTGGSGGAGGGGCATAADCPGMDTDCQTRTCTAGVCGLSFVPKDTPVFQQTPGDCHSSVCDGSGGVSLIVDDTDVPDDNA